MKKLSKRIPENTRKRLKRKKRGSFQVKGTEERPRLSVFRSNKGFYAQIINDDKGLTLMAISSLDKDMKGSVKNTVEGVKSLGEMLAKKALSKKIDKVVYDRSGYLYHGKIKSFADGARSGGLKF